LKIKNQKFNKNTQLKTMLLSIAQPLIENNLGIMPNRITTWQPHVTVGLAFMTPLSV